jgi:hypothetical protein
MYCAWEPIVRCENDAAQVNPLLNRASPWLDADSYLPSEGKVMIHNKQARRLAVRVPRWVDRDAVRIEADGRAATPFRVEGHLVFSALRQRATVTITFPVVEAIETYTLKWKQSEFWQESNCPGHTWQPAGEPARYTCRFRGNTLVEITPRDPGAGPSALSKGCSPADGGPDQTCHAVRGGQAGCLVRPRRRNPPDRGKLSRHPPLLTSHYWRDIMNWAAI